MPLPSGKDPGPVFIVPAYNAARSVKDVVQGLRGAGNGSPLEVIVVDDGSDDGTGAVALDAGAVVVRHGENRGKGAALKTGLHEALARNARVAVTVDADGQHPPEEAMRLAVYDAPEDALLLGTRNLSRDGAPRANQISNRISNFFLNRFSGHPFRDTQCGLRRYPVDATLALGLRDDGYAFESEVLLRAVRAGWAILQIPVRVVYPRPEERTTHFHSVKDPARIVRRVVLTLASREYRTSGRK